MWDYLLAAMTLIGGVAAIHHYWDRLPKSFFGKSLRKAAPGLFPRAKCFYETAGDKGLMLKQNVDYALSDIADIQYQRSLRGHCNGMYEIDFVVNVGESEVLGVLTEYSESEHLSNQSVKRMVTNIRNVLPCDNFVQFLVVTNSDVTISQRSLLSECGIAVDVISGRCTPGALITAVSNCYRTCIEKIKIAQQGTPGGPDNTAHL